MYDHCHALRIDAGAAAHRLAALEGNGSHVGGQEVLVPAAQDHAEVMSRLAPEARPSGSMSLKAGRPL